MKITVDELPNTCLECPCFNESIETCQLLKKEFEITFEYDTEIYSKCPLVKNEVRKSRKKCVICNKAISGYGNNAEPVKHGLCCDTCNYTIVLPARVRKEEICKKK